MNAKQVFQENEKALTGPFYTTINEQAADMGVENPATTVFMVVTDQDNDAYNNKFDNLEQDFDNPVISGENMLTIDDTHIGRIGFFEEEISLEQLQEKLGSVLVDAVIL